MKQKIIELLKQGYTITTAAKELECSKQNIHLHLRQLRIKNNCKTNFQLMSVI